MVRRILATLFQEKRVQKIFYGNRSGPCPLNKKSYLVVIGYNHDILGVGGMLYDLLYSFIGRISPAELHVGEAVIMPNKVGIGVSIEDYPDFIASAAGKAPGTDSGQKAKADIGVLPSNLCEAGMVYHIVTVYYVLQRHR